MNSLYTPEVRQFIRTRKWPKGLLYEVVEFEDFLRLKFYRENINALDADAKLQMATVLNETMEGIRRGGIPIYTEVAKGDGRDNGA